MIAKAYFYFHENIFYVCPDLFLRDLLLVFLYFLNISSNNRFIAGYFTLQNL